MARSGLGRVARRRRSRWGRLELASVKDSTFAATLPALSERLHTGSANGFALRIYNDAYSTSQSILSYFPGSSGSFEQGTDAALDLKLYTSGYTNTRLMIKADGKVGIGTLSPSCLLHVAGPIRTASYSVAGVPSATTAGAGTMIYVTNPTPGSPRPFWSNGSEWRDAAGTILA